MPFDPHVTLQSRNHPAIPEREEMSSSPTANQNTVEFEPRAVVAWLGQIGGHWQDSMLQKVEMAAPALVSSVSLPGHWACVPDGDGPHPAGKGHSSGHRGQWVNQAVVTGDWGLLTLNNPLSLLRSGSG